MKAERPPAKKRKPESPTKKPGGRPRGVTKEKFSTTLPLGMPARLREYAEAAGVQIEHVVTDALTTWFDAMDGKATTFKPTNAEQHRRLEVLLNDPDARIRQAVTQLLAVADGLRNKP